MKKLQKYPPPTVEVVETIAAKPIMTSGQVQGTVTTESATIDDYDWEL